MSHLRIRNWPKYQHYTDPKKGVAWVKLHVKILDDLEFLALPETHQATLLKLFCLAGRRANVLPLDPIQLGALVGAQSPIDIGLLSPWLESSDGKPFIHSRVDSRENSRVPSKDSYSLSDPDLGIEDQSKKSRSKTRGTLEETLEFVAFYDAYPKKRKRPDALKAWHQVKPDPAVLMPALDKWKRCVDWVEDGGTYVPYPASWLRARGWEDEVPADRSFSANGGRVTYSDAPPNPQSKFHIPYKSGLSPEELAAKRAAEAAAKGDQS